MKKRVYFVIIVTILAGSVVQAVPNPHSMVLIPFDPQISRFQMGDHFAEGDPAELPVHWVQLTEDFHISQYETTNQQYCNFLNSAAQAGDIKVEFGVVYGADDNSNAYPYCDTSTSNPSSQIDDAEGVFSVRTKGGRDMSDDPMVTITWYGSTAYCNWLSGQEGYELCYDSTDPNWPCDFTKNGYRLPTEAEWEYAARGRDDRWGDYFRFPWGDTITHDQANYWSDETIGYDVSVTREYHPVWDDGIWPYTAPVGSFAPNAYGLYDMAGNAFEWVNDWYDPNYFSVSPPYNPIGPEEGTHRVLLGGGWGYEAIHCRNSTRLPYEPDSRCHYRSFRVVLDLEEDCYTGPDYTEWLLRGRPESWCTPYQCHGDPDGYTEQIGKGSYPVGFNDITILLEGFNRTYSGDPVIDPWIAADFSHDYEQIGKCFHYIGFEDIDILLQYFNNPDVPGDCQTANPVSP